MKADYQQCVKGLTLEKLNQVNQGKLTMDQATKTTDHWLVVKRKGKVTLLEGAGTDGGEWAIKGPRGTDYFKTKAEADRWFEVFVEEED